MLMRNHALATMAMALGLLLHGCVEAGDLAAVRALIGEPRVSIAHHEQVKASGDGTKPPLRSDSWTFIVGGVNPTVRYGRYLNRPPEFTESHPSLTSGDMGVGLDGGPFGYWYRGSAIRVILDGQDVFAARPADLCEALEDEYGHLRLAWELGEGRRVTLHFTVPEDGRAVFARLDVEPGVQPVGRTEVRLMCYPGGFGPAHGLPSHRYVKTAQAEEQVPRDFRHSPEHPFPMAPLTGEDDWVFYGDRLSSGGSLGLLLNREDRPAGRVNLSDYGVATTLEYPADMRRIHLAFFAYSLENEPAERAFLAGLEQERAALRTIPFWPTGTEPR